MLDLLVILFHFLMKKGNLKWSLSELLFHALVAFKIKLVQRKKKGNLVSLTTAVLAQSASTCCIKIKDRGAVKYTPTSTNLVIWHPNRKEACQELQKLPWLAQL